MIFPVQAVSHTHEKPIIENKFLFPALRTQSVLDWVEHACVPDPDHPANTVSTIYYDTPDLASYREKDAGLYQRSRPRLRWYGSVGGERAPVDGTCYFEVKVRIGARREKRRMPVHIDPSVLSKNPLQAGEVTELPKLLPELSEFRDLPWIPVLVSSYTRCRYIDLADYSRIAVDYDICCLYINDVYFRGMAPVSILTGVLEIKGTHRDLSRSLFPIRGLMELSSFSKYTRCLASSMMRTAGAVT